MAEVLFIINNSYLKFLSLPDSQLVRDWNGEVPPPYTPIFFGDGRPLFLGGGHVEPIAINGVVSSACSIELGPTPDSTVMYVSIKLTARASNADDERRIIAFLLANGWRWKESHSH